MIRLNCEKASGWQLNPGIFGLFFYKSNLGDSPEIVENTLSGSNLPASISSNCLRTRLALGSASLLSLLLRGFRTGLCTTTYWDKIQPSLLVEFWSTLPKKHLIVLWNPYSWIPHSFTQQQKSDLTCPSPLFFRQYIFISASTGVSPKSWQLRFTSANLPVICSTSAGVISFNIGSATEERLRTATSLGPVPTPAAWKLVAKAWQKPRWTHFFRMVKMFLLRFEGRKDDMVAFEVWIKDSGCTPQGHTP